MIDNPAPPPAYADATPEAGAGEPGTIGPLTISVEEGLFSFTAKLEPLQRWSNNPLDRWAGGNQESTAATDSRHDPLERWAVHE